MSRTRHTPADEPYFLVRTLAAEFADGEKIAPHSHPWGQLIYAVSGVMTVWTEHGSWVVPPHWAVWAPARVSHGLRFAGTASLRTLYLRPDVASPVLDSTAVTVSPLLRELIGRAVQIGMLDARERAHIAIVDLIVHEFTTHSTPALDLPLPQSQWLRHIAEHLTNRPGEQTSLAALANRFGVGARTLERGFVAETGLSLGRWRRQARFMHALRRLGAGESVKRAASEAGYQSPSAFIAAFRAALNTTPGCYFESGRSPRDH
jgi:AraC-like DNA-binding protein